MSGYLDRTDPDVPIMTRERWLGAILAMAAAILLFVLALWSGRLAIPLLELFDNHLSRFGLIFWVLGASFLMQAESAPDDPTIPRRTRFSRRAAALTFYALGAAMIAAGAIMDR